MSPNSLVQPQIFCPNLSCTAPLNTLGSKQCQHCQTPLTYRYLWAVGPLAEQNPTGTQLSGRYYVTAPQVWLDTQPGLMPDMLPEWPEAVIPYLHLYPYRLHLPEVYGFYLPTDEPVDQATILLERGPLDQNGSLLPALTHSWSRATAVRQVYWLWQLLDLWVPFQMQGVVASLLAADNIRVEGWRVRLCQLITDRQTRPPDKTTAPEPNHPFGLADLANVWLHWVEQAQPEIMGPLRQVCSQMQRPEATLEKIQTQLNQILIEQAAQLPIEMDVFGCTDAGPQRSHNEDNCYPITLQGQLDLDGLAPNLALVCDGLAGHEGGEIASQLAVQSFKLQIRTLLDEVRQQQDVLPPAIVMDHLESLLRIVNNLIAAQNDAQGRESRQRMGTTLIMALQLPQRPLSVTQKRLKNSHEIYLMHAGDSRAYWITPNYCHLLTLDDDVVTQEIRMGRALSREALQRPDANALTQALGIRDAEFLKPTIQRFILEEDGLLLLCSDGFSDHNLVEESWQTYVPSLLTGHRSLAEVGQAWFEQATAKNGHDNLSLILIPCRVSLPPEVAPAPTGADQEPALSEDWSPEFQRQLEPALSHAERPESKPQLGGKKPGLRLAGLIGLLLLLSGLGLGVWSMVDPIGFQQWRNQLLSQPQSPAYPERR